MTEVALDELQTVPGHRPLAWTSWSLQLTASARAMSALWHGDDSPATTTVASWLGVNQAINDIGSIKPGNAFFVTFALANSIQQLPVIVCGATDLCGPNGCLAGSKISMTVAPGGQATVEMIFQAGSGTGFKNPFSIYSIATGQAEMPLETIGNSETSVYSRPK